MVRLEVAVWRAAFVGFTTPKFTEKALERMSAQMTHGIANPANKKRTSTGCDHRRVVRTTKP